MTASLEFRAKRRKADLDAKGENLSLLEVMAQVKERDERDMNREIAPLKQAPDAILIDSHTLMAKAEHAGRGVASVGKKPYKNNNKDTGIKVRRCKDSNNLLIDVNLTVLTGFSVPDVAYRVQEAVLNTASQFTKDKIDKVNIYVRGAKYGASTKQK